MTIIIYFIISINLIKITRGYPLTLSLPVPHWVGDNTDLLSNSSISKTVRVNIAFTRTFLKEYSISFLMISRTIDSALVVLNV